MFLKILTISRKMKLFFNVPDGNFILQSSVVLLLKKKKKKKN